MNIVVYGLHITENLLLLKANSALVQRGILRKTVDIINTHPTLTESRHLATIYITKSVCYLHFLKKKFSVTREKKQVKTTDIEHGQPRRKFFKDGEKPVHRPRSSQVLLCPGFPCAQSPVLMT